MSAASPHTAVLLQGCCSPVAGLLQPCCRAVAALLQRYCSPVAGLLQPCCRAVAVLLQGCNSPATGLRTAAASPHTAAGRFTAAGSERFSRCSDVAAMLRPFRCRVAAIPQPCCSHAAAMSLPCRCHAAALLLPCCSQVAVVLQPLVHDSALRRPRCAARAAPSALRRPAPRIFNTRNGENERK